MLESGALQPDVAHVTTSADPRPVPPEPPLPTDCCGDGCAVCVNDAYEEELEDHEARLAAWRARNADGEADQGETSPD